MTERNLRLAVVIPERDVVSESFIDAHICGLVDDPLVVWGSPRPLFVGDDCGILSGVARGVGDIVARVFRIGRNRAIGAVGRRLPNRLYARQLGLFLRRQRIDVVLAEYATTAIEIMDACSVSRTPLVVHFHGFDAYRKPTLLRLSESYRRLFLMAARIVVVSEHMRRQLHRLGAPPENVVCNPCGVDVRRFHGANPGATPPIFLALGRFVEKKGPLLTIDAFARVAAAVPDARLVMLGDGPLYSAACEHTKSLTVSERVQLPGSVSHHEVVRWMRRARCFVQHSRTAADGDSEGTPVAVLEASACGLPVVATRHGGINDAVVDGSSGFLVEEGDVDGMAERMIQLAREPALASTTGQAGRQHIINYYSAERSLGRLRDALFEAARKPL